MYASFLFIHSWVRWAVLLGLLYFCARCLWGWRRRQVWGPADDRYLWAFNQLFGYQVAFGLALWIGASPIVKAAFSDLGGVFREPLLFFWVALHPVTMILALGLIHMGKAHAKRVSPWLRFQTMAIYSLGSLLAILSALPWSHLIYGRPLFRWLLP